MYPVFYIRWNPSADVTYTDMSIVVYDNNTTYFSDFVCAAGNEFRITVNKTCLLTTNDLHAQIFCYPEFVGADAAAQVDFTETFLGYDTTGAALLETRHKCTLSMPENTLSTIHVGRLVKSSSCGLGAGMLLWRTHQTDDVVNLINAPFSYDLEGILTYATVYKDVTGNLRLIYDVDFSCGGLDTSVVVFAGPTETLEWCSLNVYADITGDATRELLGQITADDIDGTSYVSKTFGVSSELALRLNDVKYNGFRVYLEPTMLLDYSMYIYDCYSIFKPTRDATLSTDHTVVVAAAGDPILSKTVSTHHLAKVKSGTIYVLDYYTPDMWWGLSAKKSLYTYEDWNMYENILTYFGRFYHSPLYFNNKTPFMYSVQFTTNDGLTFDILSDIYDSSYSSEIGFYGVGPDRIYITNDSIKASTIYNVSVNPSYIDDVTSRYLIVPYSTDGTIYLVFYEQAGYDYTRCSYINSADFLIDNTISVVSFVDRAML